MNDTKCSAVRMFPGTASVTITARLYDNKRNYNNLMHDRLYLLFCETEQTENYKTSNYVFTEIKDKFNLLL